MNRYFLLALLLLAASPAFAAQPNATTLTPTELQAFGVSLVNRFFDLLIAAGGPSGTNTSATQALREFLYPAFQFQRADGTGGSVFKYTPPLVAGYTLINATTSAPADDLVAVRYFIATNETTGAGTLGSAIQPRLSVFFWGQGSSTTAWKLLSHANFNPLVSAICSSATDTPVSAESPTKNGQPVIPTLANQLVKEWWDNLVLGNGSAMLDPAALIQRADGSGGLGSAYVGPKVSNYTFGNMTETSNTEVLVARYDVKVDELLEGKKYSTAVKPRLMTFLNKKGTWKVVGYANFDVPEVKVPDTCTKPNGASKAVGSAVKWIAGAAVALAGVLVI